MRNLAFLALFWLPACSGKDDANSTADEDGDLYSPSAGDCDDTNPDVNPGVTEVYCDGLDNDCDGTSDDDRDGDGTLCSDDCNDDDATIFPDAPDSCGDKVDQNCDGKLECDCDADGYDGEQCDGSDCDDTDATINPDADDVCYDGFDSNCDGLNDDDCDGDGYTSADYGGDDCDDADTAINPGATEACYDGIDSDCSGNASDCDCDGDGVDAEVCGGADCDDEDDTVVPGAAETSVDGEDNDCDGETDEDAYCNVYAPISNGSGASRTYSTLFFDGQSYTEDVTITAFDATTGEATIERYLGGALFSYLIDQNVTCVDGTYSSLDFSASTSSIPIGAGEYTVPRIDLMPEADLSPGATWSYSYDTIDTSTGETLWTASGVFTVEEPEETTVTAGTFDTLVLTNVYDIKDDADQFTRSGTVTYYYAARLGLVLSIDINDLDGSVAEKRELTTYSGFYP